MLKELMKLWKDGSIMADVLRRLGEMVVDAGYVYTHAWDVCCGRAVHSAIEDRIRRHDKEVNRGERQVRRMLVEHLSMNPGQDASGCLAVMIMAKDIERIGDHARNVYGIGKRLREPITGYRLFDKLDAVQQATTPQFGMLQNAIVQSDEAVAHEVLRAYQDIKRKAKGLQDALFALEAPPLETVNTTLLTRFFMRANAHIGNAASGVIFPLDNIDFVSRGLRKEQESA